MLSISPGISDRIRWLAIAVVAIVIALIVGVGLGFFHPWASSVAPSFSSSASAPIASPVPTSASDQPASISRMDLQIHEQDYCQCHG